MLARRIARFVTQAIAWMLPPVPAAADEPGILALEEDLYASGWYYHPYCW